MALQMAEHCLCGQPITAHEAKKHSGRCFQCWLDDQEKCDECGKRLDKLRGEDIYIEEKSAVVCAKCWEE